MARVILKIMHSPCGLIHYQATKYLNTMKNH